MLALVALAVALAADPVGSASDPAVRPRCLEAPARDGLYRIAADTPLCPSRAPCVEPIVARPVAVVAGCVGSTAGDAWSGGTAVTGPDRFAVTDSDGHRCPSGTTAEYRATPAGLLAEVRVWTLCGGSLSRVEEPVALERVESIEVLDAAALLATIEHPAEAVRAAALEAIAVRQPEEWTCEPLGRAIRGGLGTLAAGRAIDLAATPCLAEALRTALFDRDWGPAADALGRLEPEAGRLADDLVRVAREGVPGAARPLADAIADRKTADAALRDALGDALVTPDGTSGSRQEAVAALDRLFRAAEDGDALVDGASRRGTCEGWRALLDTLAVEASGRTAAPPRVARRCGLGGLPSN